MRTDAGIYRFGPFALDPARRRLARGGQWLRVPDRHMDVLLLLTACAGQVVRKDTLIAEAWPDVIVTENNIVQAVKGLRALLGTQPDGTPYIETAPKHGYRFAAIVERQPSPHANTAAPGSGDIDIGAALRPYRAFVDGRAALETLDRDAVAQARDVFARVLSLDASLPAAHIGMATACLLAFESTRVDAVPDREALTRADRHAREGCRIDPDSGDAWGTLALVRHRYQDAGEAVAAARKAVSLDRQEWRHHLRLAFVSGGAERLRAAHRALALCPGLALAHWLAATVFVAREAFDAALEHVRASCAAQDAQPSSPAAGIRFPAVGLHLLHGLVLAARGELEAAREELARELAFEPSSHIYARECCANTWYAIGALHLRLDQRDQAEAAFRAALARVPSHALAAIGLTAARTTPTARLSNTGCKHEAPAAVGGINGAIACAAALALQGRHRDAARRCADALTRDDADLTAAWLLPVEPLLNVDAHRTAWAPALAALHQRSV